MLFIFTCIKIAINLFQTLLLFFIYICIKIVLLIIFLFFSNLVVGYFEAWAASETSAGTPDPEPAGWQPVDLIVAGSAGRRGAVVWSGCGPLAALSWHYSVAAWLPRWKPKLADRPVWWTTFILLIKMKTALKTNYLQEFNSKKTKSIIYGLKLV